MKKLTNFLLTCALVVLVNSEVHAEAYFDTKTIAPDIINRPLDVSGKEWKDEVNTIIKLQDSADEEEIKKAANERDLMPEMVAQAVDPKLTRKNYPALYKLLDNASDTSHLIGENTKKYWNTKRPYLMDKRIKPLIDAHDNPAYPSGHTTGSYVDAYILGLLIPEKREQFYKRAEEIAQHRILVGMHYPHDVKGGKQLSLLLTGAMLANPEFQKDLKSAQKELANKKL